MGRGQLENFLVIVVHVKRTFVPLDLKLVPVRAKLLIQLYIRGCAPKLHMLRFFCKFRVNVVVVLFPYMSGVVC